MALPLPQRRLFFALLASALLHAAAIGAGDLARRGFPLPPKHAATPVLQAHLLLPPDGATLLKNTLSEDDGPLPALTPPPAAQSAGERLLRRQAAQRKLAEHLFYPPEAIAGGLEGEVRLLLLLDPDGRVLEAQVVSGSGHALLDRAATEAAYAMRRLPNPGVRELILPVVFKLK
ncbi:MAG: energy transducer TonB [Sterolibacterium sp.]